MEIHLCHFGATQNFDFDFETVRGPWIEFSACTPSPSQYGKLYQGPRIVLRVSCNRKARVPTQHSCQHTHIADTRRSLTIVRAPRIRKTLNKEVKPRLGQAMRPPRFACQLRDASGNLRDALEIPSLPRQGHRQQLDNTDANERDDDHRSPSARHKEPSPAPKEPISRKLEGGQEGGCINFHLTNQRE